METAIISNTTFQFSEQTRERIVIAIRWLCMALFIYTAYAKIVNHDRFLKGLLHVHFISGFAVFLSYFVPIIEIIIALLLLVPQLAKAGLYSFTVIMIIFTVYIICALIWEKHRPCLCGGAIEKLSWTQHIWFNLAFIFLAVFAIWLIKLKHLKN